MLSRWRSEVLLLSAISGAATFLTIVLLVYFWYYQPPNFDQLEKRQVTIQSFLKKDTIVRGRLGSVTSFSFIELVAKTPPEEKPVRYVLTTDQLGLMVKAIKLVSGKVTLWVDPSQSNEVFQMQAGDLMPKLYASTYREKKDSWDDAVGGLLIILFVAFGFLTVCVVFLFNSKPLAGESK